ncbi:MAG: hypothetical protein JNL18_04495 [Planctomycetaceae bacterium]|nr:hypothetical protein [Planctomycetaceae bacterium]
MIASCRWLTCALLYSLFVGVPARSVVAMGIEAFGPAGEDLSRSPDWERGIEAILRHPARVYWYDVNGSEAAYYDGDLQAVNELLELYSQADLAEHPVVIRPGRPSAKSFDGKLTPYVVEFNSPGVLAASFLRARATTGLYRTTPRLIVHLDAELAERLAELKIPANVKLYELTARVEDALPHANDADSVLRHRAIVAVGEAADESPASVEAMQRAAEDENKSIRAAGEAALAELAAAREPDQQALRLKLREFIQSHPQYARTPSPEELLAALRAADADYQQGLTARGTLVEASPTGGGRLIAWVVTMGDERLVIEQRAVEDDDHPRDQGRFEYTNYVGLTRMGSLHGYRVWTNGKLIDAKPRATFEPKGSTYDVLIGRLLLPLGRGYSGSIEVINSVATQPDGMLKVMAENKKGSHIGRWELLIDPAADYLVRSAKAYRRDDSEPRYVVENAGVLTGGGRNVAHTARWIEGGGSPVSIAVTSVSAKADEELIRRTEERLDDPRLRQ